MRVFVEGQALPPQNLTPSGAIISTAKVKFSKALYNLTKKFTFYSSAGDLLQSDSLYTLSHDQSLDELRSKHAYFWLDVCGATREELCKLEEIFHVNPATVDEIVSNDKREKFESYENYSFLSIRTCDADQFNKSMKEPPFNENHFRHSPIHCIPGSEILYLLIFKDHVITCHNRPIGQINNIVRKLQPLSSELNNRRLLNTILECAIGEYQPLVKTLELDVGNIDEHGMFVDQNTYGKDNMAFLKELKGLRSQLMNLQRLLKPKSKIFKIAMSSALLSPPPYSSATSDPAAFGIQERLDGMIEDLNEIDESLTRSHSLYLSWVSIQQAEFSNKTNIQMQRLTVFAALGIPITVVSSVWGMNVTVPFETVGGVMASWSMLVPFLSLTLGSLLLTGFLLFLFRRLQYY